LVTYYEAQAAFAAKATKKLLARANGKVSVKPDMYKVYNQRVQRRLAKTVWAEVPSYFRGTSGKIISQWPFSPTAYLLGLRLARWFGLDWK